MLGRGLAMSVPSGWDGLPTSRLSLLDGKGEQVKQGREGSAQSAPWGTAPGLAAPSRQVCRVLCDSSASPPHHALHVTPLWSSLAGGYRPADPTPRLVECERYRRRHHTFPPGEEPESRATLRSREVATRWRGRDTYPLG